MDDFVLRALLGGVGVAAVAGPRGCFIVWQKLAYFGDTLSHSSLLGVALGLMFGIFPSLSILLVCLFMASVLTLLQKFRTIANDTLLGILAHSLLAIGLLLLSHVHGLRLDLLSYLLGDILAIATTDLYWIYIGATLTMIALYHYWNGFVALCVHPDLAEVQGVPVHYLRFLLTLLLAAVIAIGMKLIGALLMTSLLLIPAASARQFAKTPAQMAVIAGIIGGLAVIAGVYFSLQYDTPTGPSIVTMASLGFLISLGYALKVKSS